MMNAEEFIISNRERIRRYPRFVDVYAQYVYKFKAPDHALMILKETANIIPTCEIYCDIGDLFKEQKDYASAQYYYQRASDMIPRRLIPRYKLFMLYYEMNNIDAARMIGEDIVSKKNIIEGTQSIKIKMRVQKYLDKFRSTSY